MNEQMIDALAAAGFLPVDGDQDEPRWLNEYGRYDAWRPVNADEMMLVSVTEDTIHVYWTDRLGVIFTDVRLTRNARGVRLLIAMGNV